MSHYAIVVLISTLTFACVHGGEPAKNSDPGQKNELSYEQLVENSTVKSDRYAGIYQTFQADFTIETNELVTAKLKRRANYLQWTEAEYQAAREKALQENTTESKFFLRFFTPEHDYDDLAKGKSIWKIYLTINGRRVEGKVTQVKDKFVDLVNAYPYVDRFSSPYEVHFPIAMTMVERANSKVTLTSSLGAAEFDFNRGQ